MKRACLLLFATSACTDPAPQDLPAPTLTAVTPAATCGRDVAPVTLIGTGFIDGAEVVFERNGTAGYTPGGVATFGDTQIVVLTNAAEGAPAALIKHVQAVEVRLFRDHGVPPSFDHCAASLPSSVIPCGGLPGSFLPFRLST